MILYISLTRSLSLFLSFALPTPLSLSLSSLSLSVCSCVRGYVRVDMPDPNYRREHVIKVINGWNIRESKASCHTTQRRHNTPPDSDLSWPGFLMKFFFEKFSWVKKFFFSFLSFLVFFLREEVFLFLFLGRNFLEWWNFLQWGSFLYINLSECVNFVVYQVVVDSLSSEVLEIRNNAINKKKKIYQHT